MKNAFLIFLLLSSQISLGEEPKQTELDGVWKSKYLELFLPSFWESKKFEINYPKFKLTRYRHESSASKEAYFMQVNEGTFTLSYNKINSQIIDMKLKITKKNITVLKETPSLAPLKVKECAKLNITLDLMTNPCGIFRAIKENRDLDIGFLKTDEDTLMYTKDGVSEILGLLIYPLIRATPGATKK